MYVCSYSSCTLGHTNNIYFAEHQRTSIRRRKNSCNDSGICALPDELLLRVFSYLSHSSLLVCLLTCRRLSMIAIDTSLCKYQWMYMCKKLSHCTSDTHKFQYHNIILYTSTLQDSQWCGKALKSVGATKV